MVIRSEDPFRRILKEMISPSRFRHSVAVSRVSAALGRKYSWDPEKARRAALVHDCVREWSSKKLLTYVRRHKIGIPHLKFVEKYAPILLHGPVGAHFAGKKGWIRDHASLSAIRTHTLGTARMSVPQKILFVADVAADDRAFADAARVKNAAFRNLDQGVRSAMRLKLAYVVKMGKPLHPDVVKTWNAVFGLK